MLLHFQFVFRFNSINFTLAALQKHTHESIYASREKMSITEVWRWRSGCWGGGGELPPSEATRRNSQLLSK